MPTAPLRPCLDDSHGFSADIAGTLLIWVSPTCHCGAVRVRITNMAEQRVEFTWDEAITA